MQLIGIHACKVAPAVYETKVQIARQYLWNFFRAACRYTSKKRSFSSNTCQYGLNEIYIEYKEVMIAIFGIK